MAEEIGASTHAMQKALEIYIDIKLVPEKIQIIYGRLDIYR